MPPSDQRAVPTALIAFPHPQASQEPTARWTSMNVRVAHVSTVVFAKTESMASAVPALQVRIRDRKPKNDWSEEGQRVQGGDPKGQLADNLQEEPRVLKTLKCEAL